MYMDMTLYYVPEIVYDDKYNLRYKEIQTSQTNSLVSYYK